MRNLIEQIYNAMNGDTVAINDLDECAYSHYDMHGEFGEEAMLDDRERARDIGALTKGLRD